MSLPESRPANRLAQEKSPYLLQHAHNPVDWYPWGEEAFAKAAAEDKMIFLSIGYSTCHWCHVMERESFESPVIAQILNGHFVPVKVDREERPDVDQLYMNALVAMTGQGGWPCNLFLTPDLKPVWGGTYFPPAPKWGRPGFDGILLDLADAWKTRRGEAVRAGETLTGLLARGDSPPGAGGALPGPRVLEAVTDHHRRSFDPTWGGFGHAPKFPRSMALTFLLREQARTKDPGILPLVTRTLDKMAQGGMYDQLGGGFARYSTDEKWLVPHFEKMLYDNALLARAYLEAFQVTGRSEYARVAREVFAYLFRDMADPGGAFYSAEDADSEGVEGKFYVWTPEALSKALGPADAAVWAGIYGVAPGGNFEGESILHLETDLPTALVQAGKESAWWESARERLLRVRSKRIRPHRDDKILASWNALLVSSLVLGSRALGEPEYLRRAEGAYGFIRGKMFSGGRLRVSWRGGLSDLQAYLDDYAFLLAAALDLFEATFQPRYLEDAQFLHRSMAGLFGDGASGGFFFTGKDQKDASRLYARPKEGFDNACPSGNSVAALALLRLHELTGDGSAREGAEGILRAFAPQMEQAGVNFPQMLQAAQFLAQPRSEVFVTGEGAETGKLLAGLQRAFRPQAVLAYAATGQADELARFIPWAKDRPGLGGKPTVYVCRGFACQAPVHDLPSVLEAT